MKLFTILTTLTILLGSIQLKAQVSKNIHQLIALEDDEKKLTTLNLYTQSDNVEVIKIRGTRIQAKTVVTISFNNLPFLNYLTETGRYELTFIPNDGDSVANVEAKFSNELVIRGETCTEDISYIFYVPDYIQDVRVHNLNSNMDTTFE